MCTADRTFANSNLSQDLSLTCSTFTYFFVHFPALKGGNSCSAFWCQSSSGSIMSLSVFEGRKWGGGVGLWSQCDLAPFGGHRKSAWLWLEATLSWSILARWKSGRPSWATHTLRFMHPEAGGETVCVGGQGADKHRGDAGSEWCGPPVPWLWQRVVVKHAAARRGSARRASISKTSDTTSG